MNGNSQNNFHYYDQHFYEQTQKTNQYIMDGEKETNNTRVHVSYCVAVHSYIKNIDIFISVYLPH